VTQPCQRLWTIDNNRVPAGYETNVMLLGRADRRPATIAPLLLATPTVVADSIVPSWWVIHRPSHVTQPHPAIHVSVGH